MEFNEEQFKEEFYQHSFQITPNGKTIRGINLSSVLGFIDNTYIVYLGTVENGTLRTFIFLWEDYQPHLMTSHDAKQMEIEIIKVKSNFSFAHCITMPYDGGFMWQEDYLQDFLKFTFKKALNFSNSLAISTEESIREVQIAMLKVKLPLSLTLRVVRANGTIILNCIENSDAM